MLNQCHVFEASQYVNKRAAKNADIQIREITKSAEKLKWMDRFLRSYSGSTGKVSLKYLDKSRVFLAIYNGKEAGYIRIGNYSKNFADICTEEVWGVNEGYVKPAYRGNGILTALRSFAVQNHKVKVMRIETSRYLKLADYYQEQGFVFGYAIEDGELTAICVPDFLNTLLAYSRFKRAH